MRRRAFISALGGAAMASLGCGHTNADQMHLIALVSSGAPGAGPFEGPLMRGLAKHGYVPGKTVVLESRGADGHMERLPQLVAELAASKVEAIIALGYPTVHAAKDATALPIVEFSAGD